MITLKNATLRRGQQVLFQHLNWTIYPKQRIGVIGANGSGKSSLFAMLMGNLPLDKGDLFIAKQLKFASVLQETPALPQAALDFVLEGDTEYANIMQAIIHAEQSENMQALGTLYEQLSIIDGYSAPARAAQLLSGLGFSSEMINQPVSAFSGGWRMRMNLAKALMSRADILLLDEPTNHLDLDTVLWLENWLTQYTGTLLMISHDRDFLDKTVDHIAHVANQQITVFTGNYSTFETLYAQSLMQQQAVYEKQQRQLSHMQSFVDRFKAKASKARQAQSRLKAIERMTLVCAVQTTSPFQFEFREPAQCPYPLLEADEATIAYDENVILTRINISLTPKARIAVLGPNGAGKSSLIKLLANIISPAKGERRASPGLQIGYFAQHQIDELDLEATPLLHMQRIAGRTPETDLRTFLGSFGFVGDEVFKAIKCFSGGEKTRLALAGLVWQRPNLLLLDEPTNHLDLEMRQALSLALQAYEGAMLLISHDRFLIRTTTDHILLVADGKAEMFDGDVDDYEKWLLQYRKAQQLSARAAAKPSQQQNLPKKPKQDAQEKIKKLEVQCEKLSQQIQCINDKLNDAELYQPDKADLLKNYLADKSKLEKALQQAETDWMRAADERDGA